MTENKKIRLVLVVTAVLGCPLVRSAEPNAVTIPLTFENSPARVRWSGPTSPPQPNLQATHAAGITLRWPRNVDVPDDVVKSFLNDIVHREGAASFSKNQQMFLLAMSANDVVRLHRGRWTAAGEKDDPDYYGVLLYAVSEADAREMAAAYLRYVRKHFKSTLRPALEWMQNTRERAAYGERRLPEVEELLTTSTRSLEELRKSVSYRTNEEALAAIGELDRMINVARVDIAGIVAKVEAIQGYPSEKRTPAVVSKLEVMFVEEAVALRAAEARKREATDLRTHATRFIDLNNTIREATDEKTRLGKQLEEAPSYLQEGQRRLAELEQREPRVPDNRVFIYPVHQEPDIGSVPEIYGPPKPKTTQP
jgi:hypothetical protein